MGTEIESFLKTNGSFVRVADFPGPIPDMDYVEGAIVCRIGGQDLLSTEHWDLVDQLWAYLVDGLTKICAGDEFDGFFPDQPLKLRLKLLSEYCVEVTIGDDIKRFDRSLLVTTLATGAQQFFNEMNRLAPDSADTWHRYLKESESLL